MHLLRLIGDAVTRTLNQTHGFRGWERIVKEGNVICNGNARKFGLRPSGRRSALGSIVTKRVCKWVLDVVRHDPTIDKREIESPVQLTIIFEPKHGCQIRYDALGFEFNLG